MTENIARLTSAEIMRHRVMGLEIFNSIKKNWKIKNVCIGKLPITR
jgi:hypothetical protein